MRNKILMVGIFLIIVTGMATGIPMCTEDRECDDMDPCTRDVCEGGVCRYVLEPEGTPCPGGICNDQGLCIMNETICDDGRDNDGDGLIDCDDSDCIGSPDCPGRPCEQCPYPICDGICPQPLICVPAIGAERCECRPEEIEAPEFMSIGIALAVLLTTPAFAYLIVKKRR